MTLILPTLGEPAVMLPTVVKRWFSSLTEELDKDNAKYICYGVMYSQQELLRISQFPVTCGIQAIEYLTFVGELSVVNISVGFFAFVNGYSFEQRFGSRTLADWLPKPTEDQTRYLREDYGPRFLIWLSNPVNFVPPSLKDA